MAGQKFVANSPQEMAKAVAEMARRLAEMDRLVRTRKGRTMLKAAQLVVARSKEIQKKKNHVVTGTMGRTWNAQLLREDSMRVVAEVGNPMEYAPSVEALTEGPVRAQSVGPRGGKIPGRGKGGGILGPAFDQTFRNVTDVLEKEGINDVLVLWDGRKPKR